MFATCVHTSVAELGPHLTGSQYSPGTEFGLRRGAHYDVYGIGMFRNAVLALVLDDGETPRWVPIGLLDVGVATAPAHWEFQVYDAYGALGPPHGEHRWVFRWGYPELVRGHGHSDALLEWDVEARRIFFEEVAQRRGRDDGEAD